MVPRGGRVGSWEGGRANSLCAPEAANTKEGISGGGGGRGGGGRGGVKAVVFVTVIVTTTANSVSLSHLLLLSVSVRVPLFFPVSVSARLRGCSPVFSLLLTLCPLSVARICCCCGCCCWCCCWCYTCCAVSVCAVLCAVSRRADGVLCCDYHSGHLIYTLVSRQSWHELFTKVFHLDHTQVRRSPNRSAPESSRSRAHACWS